MRPGALTANASQRTGSRSVDPPLCPRCSRSPLAIRAHGVVRARVVVAVTALRLPIVVQVAQALESDDVEVGAVNCKTEATLCAERFNLRSYPTVRLLNRARGMQQE